MSDRDTIRHLFDRLIQEWDAFDNALCDATEEDAH